MGPAVARPMSCLATSSIFGLQGIEKTPCTGSTRKANAILVGRFAGRHGWQAHVVINFMGNRQLALLVVFYHCGLFNIV